MSRLTDLLALDEEAIVRSRQWLMARGGSLLYALDQAAEVFFTIHRAADQCLALDRSVPPHSAYDDDAEWGPIVRLILLTMCERAYYWSASDLLRQRTTTSLGLHRIQVEAAALGLLCLRDPTLGKRWYTIKTEAEGRSFWRATRNDLLQVVRDYDLKGAWDRGAGWALHVRPQGIVTSISFHPEGDNAPAQMAIRFHEGINEPEDLRIGRYLHVLVTQAHLFRLWLDAFPELDDPFVIETWVPRFRDTVTEEVQRYANTFSSVREIYRELIGSKRATK